MVGEGGGGQDGSTRTPTRHTSVESSSSLASDTSLPTCKLNILKAVLLVDFRELVHYQSAEGTMILILFTIPLCMRVTKELS